jgi:hypothetical protein
MIGSVQARIKPPTPFRLGMYLHDVCVKDSLYHSVIFSSSWHDLPFIYIDCLVSGYTFNLYICLSVYFSWSNGGQEFYPKVESGESYLIEKLWRV